MRHALIVALAGLLCACGSPEDPANQGSGNGAGGASGSGGSGGGSVAPCTADLQKDAENCGACGHSCLGAPCEAGLCQPIQLAEANGVGGLAVDDVSVFAADMDLSRVLSVPKTSGDPKVLASLQQGPNAPVVAGGALYWCNLDGTITTPGASIMRLRLGDAEPTVLADREEVPNGLAIDGTYAYWTDASVRSGAGRVSRVALAGGMPEDLARNLYSPFGLAADRDNLYWTDYAQALSLVTGRVVTMPKTGGAIRILADGQIVPGRVQVDDSYVYWLNKDIDEGGIYRTLKTGGPIETIAANERAPRDLVVDAGRAYWVTTFSKVRTAPITGGIAQTLFTDPMGTLLLAMAQDDRALYWASDRIELSTVEAAVWKLAKPVPPSAPPPPNDGGARPPDASVPRNDGPLVVDAPKADTSSPADVAVERPLVVDAGPCGPGRGGIGASCLSSGSCCTNLICLTVGTDPPRCCTPVGGTCSQESDCCGNGLSCVNGTCCGTSLLGCGSGQCCESIGYYCNPGNYCSLRPDARP